MPIGQIRESRSKKLQQAFNFFVQDWINEKSSLEAYKDLRKGPRNQEGPWPCVILEYATHG